MGTNLSEKPRNSTYPVTFRNYIRWGAEQMLDLVQRGKNLSPMEREQILHILSYGLGMVDAWSVSRDLLFKLAPKMEQAGLREDWLPYLQRGIERCQEVGDVKTQAEFEMFSGILYRLLGQWDSARMKLEFSVEHFRSIPDDDGQARALNRLAFLARLQGNHKEASTLIAKALHLCNDGSEAKALCHTTQGVLFLDQREWHLAQYHFEETLRLWLIHENPRLIAWAYSDLGVCQWHRQHFRAAIESYMQAIHILEEIEDPVLLAATQMNLGLAYTDVREYRKALDLYALAEPVFRRVHDLQRLAMIYNNQGLVYQKLEQWVEAEQAFRASIEQWHELEADYPLAEVMDELGKVYTAQQSYNDAHRMFHAALALLDTMQEVPDQGYLRSLIQQHLAELQSLDGEIEQKKR